MPVKNNTFYNPQPGIFLNCTINTDFKTLCIEDNPEYFPFEVIYLDNSLNVQLRFANNNRSEPISIANMRLEYLSEVEKPMKPEEMLSSGKRYNLNPKYEEFGVHYSKTGYHRSYKFYDKEFFPITFIKINNNNPHKEKYFDYAHFIDNSGRECYCRVHVIDADALILVNEKPIPRLDLIDI
jgi:hypothetical protein